MVFVKFGRRSPEKGNSTNAEELRVEELGFETLNKSSMPFHAIIEGQYPLTPG